MKKLILAITILIVGVTLFSTTASAHSLIVRGSTSCVREDGSWDWVATYAIPNEPWAEGLTVTVTWNPSSSGTTSDDYVYVSAHGVFSNQNTGDGSTKIWKGEKCPVDTTTTTITTVVDTTTTTTTVPDTTTTTPVETTTTTVPDTTTTVVDTTTTIPVETTTTVPSDKTTTTLPPVTTTTVVPPGLPPTGVSNWWVAIIALSCIITGIAALRIKRLGSR